MRTDTDNLIDAGRAAATPVFTDSERGGIPFLVGKRGVRSLERFCAAPVRARGRFHAASAADAQAYLGRMKGSNTVIFWKKPIIAKMRGHAVAVIDFHGANGEAGFCEHTIHFRCHASELNQFKCPVMRGSYHPPKIK